MAKSHEPGPVRSFLTIAGSDPSGGAGIQADLRVAAKLGLYGFSAITAVTAQNSKGVAGCWEIPSGQLEAQLESIFSDFSPSAVKIGFVPNVSVVEHISRFLCRYPVKNIVVDPIISFTLAANERKEEFVEALVDLLFPLATLVTPNLPELEFIEKISGKKISDSAKAWLVKGGHDNLNHDICLDVLYQKIQEDFSETAFEIKKSDYFHSRIETCNTHGSGCVLSSAIACFLAKNFTLEKAVGMGIEFTHEAMDNSKDIKMGKGSYGPAFLL